MEKTWESIEEDIAPGAEKMDMSWMDSFWEVFTECVIEMDSRYIITNVRRKAGNGHAIANVVGKSFPDLVVRKDRNLVLHELNQLKTAAAPYARFQIQCESGRYYRWTLIAFRNGNNEFSGCRGVAVDVTEQTKKETTLNWQRAIIEEGSEFVSIADMDGLVLYSNPGAYKMTGYSPASGALAPERIFTPAHLRQIKGEGLENVMRSGTWTGLGELLCMDGSLTPIEHTMFSIKNAQEEAIMIATIIRDITVFLEHERKLEKARKAAEAANAAKSEFLSRMSHEIRTPMNAIIGMINIGLGTNDVNRKDYCLRRADNASKHLLGILNDILDMSKIEAEKFELSNTVFDFEKTLKNITNMANVRAEEKQQNFIVNLDYDVPEYIFGDELRLSQVITNLLTNAIKFTQEKGTIILSIIKVREDNGDVDLQVEVSDNGIGISEEQQKKLFRSFNQADSAISQNFGGTGLGLAISKRIVELMGGEIWIESKLGEGAKFFFTFKTEIVKDKRREQLSARINVRKLRILAVDNCAETRDYFSHVMDALKLRCDVATDGPEAIRMIGSAAGTPYNIFFVDWRMPGMDGIELSRKIKEINGEDSLVIMISGNDWHSVEKDAIAAGISYFIPKPLFPSTLINAINTCMGSEIYEPSDDVEHCSPDCAHDFDGRTILVAEDVEINREIISAILEGTNALIEFADNGKVAVSMFNENPLKYDLILMDINMPEMDGNEATRKIRSLDQERAKDIPIIAMTANVFKEDIEKCLESGMNNHIGKPIDANDLFAHMCKYLQ